MKKTLIYIFYVITALSLIYCRNTPVSKQDEKIKKNEDTIQVAFFVPEADLIEIEKSNDNFITRIFKFYNRGSQVLNIYKVEASCGCSNATVLASQIPPSDSGSLYLSINLKGLYDERNIVEYRIFSNSINSPAIIRIKVIDPRKEK